MDKTFKHRQIFSDLLMFYNTTVRLNEGLNR